MKSLKNVKQGKKTKKGTSFPIAGIDASAGGLETLSTNIGFRQSETALGNSQEKLLKAQQVARMGFWSRSFKTDEIYWSDQIFDLYGIDILKKKPDIALTMELVHPEDREFVEKNFDLAIRGIREYDIQHRILRPDGKIIWVHSRAELTRDAGGMLESLIGTVVDITELKETAEKLRKSEEMYRSLVEFTDDSIYLVDRNGRYQFVNAKYLSRFNRPLDELINRPYSEFHSQQATKKFQNDLKTIFKTMKSLQYEHQSEKDGRYFIRTLTPVRDAGGAVAAVTVISKDITEKKKIEDQLLQSQKMETLGTLVAGVAHEINNPNSLIMLNVPILQDIWRDIQPIMKQHALKKPQKKYGGLTYTYIDKKLKTLLSDMRAATARIANIVKKLKDFARPSDIDDKQPVQINDAVENAVRLAQTTLRKSGIEPEVTLSEKLPLIQGDPGSIEQIVLNLLINAFEAVDPDKGKINLTTGVTKGDAGVYISVADNGRGINPFISDKIFDPFVTTKQAAGGTGLGLSVTYNLVKAHDGEISFKSEAGKGTVFTVSFPTGVRKNQS
ncbi:PAS domain S-box protein [Thermodesulfobacteriota bacterium]